MMLRRRLQATLLITSLLAPTMAAAQDANKCFERVVGEMSGVQDEYRSHLFGSRKDRDGNVTVLTGGRTQEEREGIFETEGRATSELVEPVVDSYRVYRCRAMAVCQAMGQSFATKSGNVTLKQLGCEDITSERYGECFFAAQSDASQTDAQLQSQATDLTERCRTLVQDTLDAEKAVLRVAVAYDAGYRAMLQFAGIMDWVLLGFPTQTVKAVADMVNLLGKLHVIPCFIGQCDHPDSDDIN